MENILSLKEMIEKVDKLKKDNILDLSSDQDLSIAIMNLVSIEEHFFFTGAKTGKPKYYDLLNEVREMRKSLLKRIIKDYEGEVWCISKHLLAASYRLMEVGTKAQGKGQTADAQEMFKKAYDLYSLFWGLNMKLIDLEGVKKIEDDALNNQDHAGSANSAGSADLSNSTDSTDPKHRGLAGRFGDLVKKVVNCCIE